ncbi:MFS transporter [Ornithinimicrobium cavernae]|uniref:MFS transporter n=1 Tax=Ornithinimicrobium cavernae TaxID=2666047 RepID=UPI001F01F564|nr:MFS transporter [Ornithinimicrobium cavernae]
MYVALGVLESAADNAALSVLPSLVPQAQLDRANGRISAAQLVADEFVGPPLGGVLFGLAVAVPVYAMGGLYLAAAVFFLALPRTVTPAGGAAAVSRPTLFAAAWEGASWLRGHRLLGGLALVSGVASLAYMVPFSVLVLWARDVLGLGATGYGLLLSLSALGGLVGSFATAPVRERFGYRTTILGALVLGAGTMMALGVTSTAWLAGPLLAAYILHAVVWGICVAALRQRLVPDDLRGRVNASARLLGLIGLTAGALIGGAVASAWGLEATFLVGGALFAGCAAVVPWVFRGAPGPR